MNNNYKHNDFQLLDTKHTKELIIKRICNSKETLIISPYINYSEVFNLKQHSIKKIATVFSEKVFIKNSSDINFFIKPHETGTEIKNIPNLHAKIYLFDDCAVIGSSNFTSGGLENNLEYNTFISKESPFFQEIKNRIVDFYNQNGEVISESDIEKMKNLEKDEKNNNLLKKRIEKYRNKFFIVILPAVSKKRINDCLSKISSTHLNLSGSIRAIKDSLEKSNYEYMEINHYQLLMKYSYTTGSYKNAVKLTQELTKLLFGYLIPSKIKNFGANTYWDLKMKSIVEDFHEKKILKLHPAQSSGAN